MGPGFSRDVGAAERARGVNQPSLGCSRSRCCSMLLPVKRVPSLLPEAKQSIARYAVGCHCTTCDIPLHISLHISERCPISLRSSWVLRSMVSCVKTGTRLDRPRSTAVPKARPRSWWASRHISIPCLASNRSTSWLQYSDFT